MSKYETPAITELGSIADFTRASGSGPYQDALYGFFGVDDPDGSPWGWERLGSS